MLEVCWEHNYSNDMLRLVTDEDSKLYAGTDFLKNKNNKRNSYFCLVKKFSQEDDVRAGYRSGP